MLKMLYATADKSRIFTYQNARAEKKPFVIKLSVYNGSIITGWRTLKDESVFHPTTGKQVGEIQVYEVKVLTKDGQEETVVINGYPSFSEARYGERIDCTVNGRKEDWAGNLTLDVQLPDNRTISIDSRFVN